MTKKDFRSAIGLTILVMGLILSLLTGFLDAIIVPVGLTLFGILCFITALGFVFYTRRYIEKHPYVPYAGRYAHVLCPECLRAGADNYSIEVRVGTAIEGWSVAGRYFRKFKREYQASCSRGHSWKYDPILETNSRKKSAPRAPRTEYSKQKAIKRMRGIRKLFHDQVFPEGNVLNQGGSPF